jgi:hypothetical protein
MAGPSYFKRGEWARGKAAWEPALALAPNAPTRARSRPPPRTGAGLGMAELDRWFEDYKRCTRTARSGCARPTRSSGRTDPRPVIEKGWSVAAVASAFEVSTRTVRKWLARFCRDGDAGLQNRSPAPHLVANKLTRALARHDCAPAPRLPMTGEELPSVCSCQAAPSRGISARLGRLGAAGAAGWAQLAPREPARSYTRARARDLIHLDVTSSSASGASAIASPRSAPRIERRRLGVCSRGG